MFYMYRLYGIKKTDINVMCIQLLLSGFVFRDASLKERQTGENIVFRPQNVSGNKTVIVHTNFFLIGVLFLENNELIHICLTSLMRWPLGP